MKHHHIPHGSTCVTCIHYDAQKYRRQADDPLGYCILGHFRTYETETCARHVEDVTR